MAKSRQSNADIGKRRKHQCGNYEEIVGKGSVLIHIQESQVTTTHHQGPRYQHFESQEILQQDQTPSQAKDAPVLLRQQLLVRSIAHRAEQEMTSLQLA